MPLVDYLTEHISDPDELAGYLSEINHDGFISQADHEKSIAEVENKWKKSFVEHFQSNPETESTSGWTNGNEDETTHYTFTVEKLLNKMEV